jgi:hypothetical protein
MKQMKAWQDHISRMAENKQTKTKGGNMPTQFPQCELCKAQESTLLGWIRHTAGEWFFMCDECCNESNAYYVDYDRIPNGGQSWEDHLRTKHGFVLSKFLPKYNHILSTKTEGGNQ